MSIVALQARARRLGEIRLGDTMTKDGKTFPVKLNTFRLTSAAKGLLDQAAELWNGNVVPWQATPSSAPKWQLVTKTHELAVIVPPQDPDDLTWYEAWTAAGLQRRCDGEHIVNKGDPMPCVCDPDNRECKMVTRLRVMLPDLPDVGVWQLSSTGYYAASEMAMSLEIVMRSAQENGLLPRATLAIEQREIKRPGEQIKKFAVPVLRFADTLDTFIALPTADSSRALPGGTAAGEGDGTVQPRLNPPAAATPDKPDSPEHEADFYEAEIIDESQDRSYANVHAVVHAVVAQGREDEQWAELLEILNETADEGTMGVVQDRTRRLYRFMHGVDLWDEHAKEAALTMHYNTEHLTDLRKAELNEFAVKSFDAAREKVATTP